MFFCKHEWKLLSETVTKSKIEVSTAALGAVNVSIKSLPWQLCDAERKHIQVFSCSKCGKINRYVEEI